MSELLKSNTQDISTPEQLPLSGYDDVDDDEPRERREAAEKLRTAYEGWLKRRGVEPETIPHFTMGKGEFNLFRNVGIGSDSSPIYSTIRDYNIPQDEEYIWVELEADGPNLMVVTEDDFGTVIDRSRIAMDFQDPDIDPGNPPTPERLDGALITVDISDTLAVSEQELRILAERLTEGNATDPFSSENGDIGVRAGGLAAGQKDAYVWEVSPFTKSVDLTVAFPRMYDSICIVSGQRREAANGKVGMAQIENPTVVLKIEGEALRELQGTYRKLYRQPDFALTDSQRMDRDSLFNGYLKSMISHAANENNARDAYEEHYTRQPLRERTLPLPQSRHY